MQPAALSDCSREAITSICWANPLKATSRLSCERCQRYWFRPVGLTFAPCISYWFRPVGLTFAPCISYLFHPVGLTFAPCISYLFRPVGLTFAPLINGGHGLPAAFGSCRPAEAPAAMLH